MSRKAGNSAINILIGSVVVIGLIVFIIQSITKTVGYFIPITVVVCLVAALIIIKKIKYNNRKKYLLEKYTNPEIVENILGRNIWQGQTEEQLLDTLGVPIEKDNNVLKTKTRNIWKYHKISEKRFGLKITVENGVVVGWEKKA